MFIHNLTPSQQSIFLGMAIELIEIDGQVDDREFSLVEELKSLCSVESEPVKITSNDDLATLFLDQKSRVSLLLELISIACVDENYDEKEKNYISQVAGMIKVPEVLLEDLESWAQRQMTLMQEAIIFMEN
ncbi:TerB family tellurite resistance protein [Alkalimarinus coralli]|uniref:TerB family tellurite resistance protein n=1 Tax=Alkalimarinus coralli TaxID=2935863 RepID=UPI00202AFCE4|nr:TerB family tellurite resistance protein [Alkalimarinus coralli]